MQRRLREPRPERVEVDAAQRGEGEAEDDDVGARLGRRSRRKRGRRRSRGGAGGERAVEAAGARREAFGEAPGELVVAAVDVEAFVDSTPKGP